MEGVEVSLPQFRLLMVLDELGPASSQRCAHALGVVGSSVTRLADRLDASGHLVRGRDADNRSLVVLELTDAGREIVQRVQSHRRAELGRALDLMAPEERAACAAALRTLREGLAGSVEDAARPHLPF